MFLTLRFYVFSTHKCVVCVFLPPKKRNFAHFYYNTMTTNYIDIFWYAKTKTSENVRYLIIVTDKPKYYLILPYYLCLLFIIYYI